jgi:1,4-dihydroxy-2-naphthoyl-CoA synthase
MTLIAKPVIDKQFWILQKDNEKIGNIKACNGGYQVKIDNQITQYKTIRMATRHIDIKFEAPVKLTKPKVTVDRVHGYPVTGRVYNPMWDVSQQLPVYTQTAKSKSWIAAGWYNVRKGRHWKIVQAPKLIVLQRYPYQGPFHSEDEAHDNASNQVR